MRPRFNLCKVVPNSLSMYQLVKGSIEDATVISLFVSVSYGTVTIAGGAGTGESRPEAGLELMKPHKVIQA